MNIICRCFLGFGHMTRELMSLAGGKIVLALEGGYEMSAICEAVEMCMKALQGLDIPPIKEEELVKAPCKTAIDTLENTINIQGESINTFYWVSDVWMAPLAISSSS